MQSVLFPLHKEGRFLELKFLIFGDAAVAGGALGGSLAVFRNAPPLPHVLSMGVNSALVSFGFFSTAPKWSSSNIRAR